MVLLALICDPNCDSPLLFGRFLMSLGAFVSLEDISDALPPYHEEVVSVDMDQPMRFGSGSWRSKRKCSESGLRRLASRKSKLSLKFAICPKSTFRRQYRSRQR